MATRSIADPVRIAILGGGVAALSAAYELSHSRQQGRFKVTVYQLGWRLGGKCASGRDPDDGMRITEHGPHLLFGFYDNGFEMMDECYADLHRPVGHPFRSFMDALIGSNDCCVMENIAGVWSPWQPVFALPGKPGAEGALSRWQVALNAIGRLAEHIEASGDVFDDAHNDVDKVDVEKAFQGFDALLNRHCNARLAAESKTQLTRIKVEDDAHRGLIVIRGALRLMKASAAAAQERAKKIEIKNGEVPHEDALALAEHFRCLQQLIQFVGTFFARGDDDVRHWIILGDLGATVLLGATLGELLLPTRRSLLAANKFEYQDWLRDFHAMDDTINSAIVTAMYDTVFGYLGGDIHQGGDIEAGSAVRAQLDMVSCRGNFFWKMRAGTGDVIAAPLYERLKAQGVEFQFFSQVVDVVPSADGPSVAEVHIVRQAEVLNQPYRPLLECKGIPVWPDRPDLDQLKNGQSYQDIDFEAYSVPENAHRLRPEGR